MRIRPNPNTARNGRSARKRSCIILGLVIGATGLGCHDAAYRERRAVRDRRIDVLFESIPDLQRGRDDSTRWVLKETERMREWRWDHFGKTIEWSQKVEGVRQDRRRRQPFEDQPSVRSIRTGHPELIGPTWADMVY